MISPLFCFFYSLFFLFFFFLFFRRGDLIAFVIVVMLLCAAVISPRCEVRCRRHFTSLFVESRLLEFKQHLQKLIVVRGLLAGGGDGRRGAQWVRGTRGKGRSLLVQPLTLVLANHVKETVHHCRVIFLQGGECEVPISPRCQTPYRHYRV